MIQGASCSALRSRSRAKIGGVVDRVVALFGGRKGQQRRSRSLFFLLSSMAIAIACALMMSETSLVPGKMSASMMMAPPNLSKGEQPSVTAGGAVKGRNKRPSRGRP